MQKHEMNTPLTLDDLCSFELFKLNKDIEGKKDNLMDNTDSGIKGKNKQTKAEKDDNKQKNEEEQEQNQKSQINEDLSKDQEERNEIEESEEEKNAIKLLRSFPNVAFSRFSNLNPYKPQLKEPTTTITNYSNTRRDNTQQSIPHFVNQGQFTNSLNQFFKYDPSYITSSTFNSSINSTLYTKDTIHRSMPIQPVYLPYSQFNCQNKPNRGSYPLNVGYNNYPFNYYNPNMSMMYANNPNSSLSINTINSNSQTERKKNKKLSVIENYNTLEDLLTSLKNGKQIGNYIKERNNSDTMINLIKKLSPNEISELIEMIKPKLKEIMITNNKFCQKLFEQCNAEQRLQIMNTIQHTFIEIALNKWGSYSLQALIKVISLPDEQELVKKFIEGKVYELAMDKQANFVLQKLILLFNEKGMESITDEIFDIFHHLIYNSSGIGLLKNLVLTNKGSDIRKKFVMKIIDNLDNIINNSTGHSLILQMMDKWDYETCKPMIIEIIKDINKYALMKYSSIIIFKCVSISDIKIIKSIYSTIFRTELVFQLMKTETGNDIIKELFNKMSKKGRAEAYNTLKMTLGTIKENNYNSILSIPDYVKELIFGDE